jgi:hypothetical protein
LENEDKILLEELSEFELLNLNRRESFAAIRWQSHAKEYNVGAITGKKFSFSAFWFQFSVT